MPGQCVGGVSDKRSGRVEHRGVGGARCEVRVLAGCAGNQV